MISAISNVSFRGETQPADFNALISSPGKYSQNAAPQSSAAKGDEVDLSTSEEKKSNKTAIIISSVLGALALTWIGLGIAVGKGKLTKVEGTDLKFGQKVQNFFHTIGNSAKSAYDSTLGKWFGKSEQAAETASTSTSSPTSGTTNS